MVGRNKWICLLMFFHRAFSYNQPKFCSEPSWTDLRTTFVRRAVSDAGRTGLFIDQNNTVYIQRERSRKIEIRTKQNVNSLVLVPATYDDIMQTALFVTSNDDIYVANIGKTGQINKWRSSYLKSEYVTYFGSECTSIFIDTIDNFYCSMREYHQVALKSLRDDTNTILIIAGIGYAGATDIALNQPRGIFVTRDFDLYVSDAENNRVQFFRSGSFNGITVAGTLKTIELKYPTSIVLDGNNHLYIVDSNNHRIVASSSNGFRCVIGCTSNISEEYRNLDFPINMAFDTNGHIYVTSSTTSGRVQKFITSTPICNSANEKWSIINSSISHILLHNLSVYSSKLTVDSQMYERTDRLISANYYYESIQITGFSNDIYTFSINSSIDMYGYFYEYNFNPINPFDNLIFKHYGYASNNLFKVRNYLQSNKTYILVITPYKSKAIGSFSVVITGRTKVNFTIVNSSIVQSSYSSNLTSLHPQTKHFLCGSANHYYEPLKLIFHTTGTVRLLGNSNIFLCVFLYENDFNPYIESNINSIYSNTRNDPTNHFKFDIFLQANILYILVVSACHANMTGSFHIITYGSSSTFITRMTNNNTWNEILTIQSTYTSMLIESSQKLGSLRCRAPVYSYVPISITVGATGVFYFDINATIDVHLYLYQNNFYPTNRYQNLLSWNDDSCRMVNQQLKSHLMINKTYILIVMANKQEDIGQFSITSYGQSEIVFNSMNMPTYFLSAYKAKITMNQTYLESSMIGLSVNQYIAVEINVNISGFYEIFIWNSLSTAIKLYQNSFHPFRPKLNLILHNSRECGLVYNQINFELQATNTYVLLISMKIIPPDDIFPIKTHGPSSMTYNEIIMIQSTYTSALTKDSPTYSRICRQGSYHYEIIEISVQKSGLYGFRSDRTILLSAYIYENKFDPFDPDKNLLMSINHDWFLYKFEIVIDLKKNIKYFLIITTSLPYIQGPFSILVEGPSQFNLQHIDSIHDNCRIGDQCSSHTRAIGLTLDDIFYNKTRSNISLHRQSFFVKITAIITMIMFAAGLINGILSLLTFQNAELQKIGCGMYLFASSITSLLTISLFTLKFWLFIFVEMNIQMNLFMIQVSCILLEPLLKASLYLDGWLNACVAIERMMTVYKHVNFNKIKSKYVARWIIRCLPLFIVCTLIHEPFHRNLFQYQSQTYKLKHKANNTQEKDVILYDLVAQISSKITNKSLNNEIDDIEYRHDQIQNHRLCIVKYSNSMQKYNIFILYFHLLVPFFANLFSALYIIFGTARQRSIAEKKKTQFKTYVIKQMKEHKQLLVSPIILLILSLPRLVIVFVPGCINPSNSPWLYISGYFSSFIPSILVFVIFVLPSDLYREKLKEKLKHWRQRFV